MLRLAKEYRGFDIQWGHSSSPVLYQDSLILLCYHSGSSYLLALDKRTGKTVWKTDRNIRYGTDNGDYKKAYATPALFAGPLSSTPTTRMPCSTVSPWNRTSRRCSGTSCPATPGRRRLVLSDWHVSLPSAHRAAEGLLGLRDCEREAQVHRGVEHPPHDERRPTADAIGRTVIVLRKGQRERRIVKIVG